LNIRVDQEAFGKRLVEDWFSFFVNNNCSGFLYDKYVNLIKMNRSKKFDKTQLNFVFFFQVNTADIKNASNENGCPFQICDLNQEFYEMIEMVSFTSYNFFLVFKYLR
jgi:hypothetical protein